MSPIANVTLGEMQSGQMADFFALLCERKARQTKDGKPFFSVRFRDAVREAAAPVWSDSPLYELCEDHWRVGQHFKIRGVFQDHEKYGPQITIDRIRPIDAADADNGYDPAKLIPQTPFDRDELWTEAVAAIDSITDEPLRRLVRSIWEGREDELRELPAASRNHHAYVGGFLEHTVSVLRTGIHLADKYRPYYADLEPPLNRDLIVAGCLLHDIGKLQELATEASVIDYTIPGRLIGHILLGRDLVREAAREIDGLDPGLLTLLEHVIVSHQGLPEWGSPQMPMIPEALLVHYADDIDAKLHIAVAALSAAADENDFTDTRNVMRRRFLRNRDV